MKRCDEKKYIAVIAFQVTIYNICKIGTLNLLMC